MSRLGNTAVVRIGAAVRHSIAHRYVALNRLRTSAMTCQHLVTLSVLFTTLGCAGGARTSTVAATPVSRVCIALRGSEDRILYPSQVMLEAGPDSGLAVWLYTPRDSVILTFISGNGTWQRVPGDSLRISFLAGSQSWFLTLREVRQSLSGTAFVIGDFIGGHTRQGSITGVLQPCVEGKRAT